MSIDMCIFSLVSFFLQIVYPSNADLTTRLSNSCPKASPLQPQHDFSCSGPLPPPPGVPSEGHFGASWSTLGSLIEPDGQGSHVARVSKNIVPNGHGPPTGRPWSGHVDRNSHICFRFRFLCKFCTLQMPICHDLARVMASGKPLDRSRRPSSLKLHAQLTILEPRMPMTKSKGGGVALP